MGRKSKRGGGGGPPQRPHQSQSLSGSTAGEQSNPLPQEQAKIDQPQEASSSSSNPASSNADLPSEEVQKKMAEEERRKRIEAKVFAARLKQQRPPSVLPKNKQSQVQKKSEQLQSFWDSMSTEKKRQFLQIRAQDLIDYLMGTKLSLKNRESLVETLEEALTYGEKSRNHQNLWEFWLCPHCDEISTDKTLQLKHVFGVHGKRIIVRKADPINQEWGHMIMNGTWKPVDIPQALTIIEGLEEDCSVDDLRNQIWPCSDDTVRTALLERIRYMIIHIWGKRYFAASNLASVMAYTTRELNYILPEHKRDSLILKMAQTLSSIRFLGVRHLNGIILFLESLSQGCDAFELPDSDGSFRRTISGSMKIEIEEKIELSYDESPVPGVLLLLDERFLMPEAAFMDWMFYSDSVWEELEHWRRLKNDKHDLIAKYSQVCDRTVDLLASWCKSRDEFSEVEDVFQSLAILCEAEKMKKDAAESFESVLRKRLEEIHDSEDISPERKKRESDTIQIILKDAQGLDANQLERELASTRMKRWFDDLRSNDASLQQDALVFLSLKHRMRLVFLEINRIDARIMRIYSAIESVSGGCKNVSSLDYRAFLLPLLKCFLKENIKKLVDKDAEEKAAALIAELKLGGEKAGAAGAASGVKRSQKRNDEKHKQAACKIMDVPQEEKEKESETTEAPPEEELSEKTKNDDSVADTSTVSGSSSQAQQEEAEMKDEEEDPPESTSQDTQEDSQSATPPENVSNTLAE